MKQLYLALLSVVFVGCATTAATDPTPQELANEKGYDLGAEVDEIFNYRVNGWNHVSSKALIINAGPSTKYLLTLKTRCHDLSTAEVIGYTANTNRLTRFDAVVVKDPPGNVQQKCYIEKMYEISKSEK